MSMSILESKAYVKKKLQDHIFKTTTKLNGRSSVWKHFSIVTNSNGVKIDFATCDGCQMVFRYKKKIFYLKSHIPKCSNPKDGSKDSEVISIVCSKWIDKIGLPLSLSESNAFHNMLQETMEIAKNKKYDLNLERLLPTRRAISQNISRLYELYLPQIKKEVREISFGAITTDIWTDSCKRITYLSVRVHYSLNGQLRDRILVVKRSYCDQPNEWCRTTTLNEVLLDFDLNISNFVHIINDTDRSSVKTLKPFGCIVCAIHILDCILNEVIAKSVAIQDLFRKCDVLLEEQHFEFVQSTIEERYVALQYIIGNWNLIIDDLSQSRAVYFINEMDRNQIEQLLKFLLHFKNAVLDFQQSNKPTLCLVCPHYFNLINKCAISDGDTNLTMTFKQNCAAIMKSKLFTALRIEHLVATFLHPKGKRLARFPEDVRQKVYIYIATLAAKIQRQDDDYISVLENSVNFAMGMNQFLSSRNVSVLF